MENPSSYSIRQAAQRTGLSAHTLRWYERIGLIDPVARDNFGYRTYTDELLTWLQFLHVLRSTGMTRRQLWRLSLLETGLIGSSAGLIAIPTGLVLAVVLIYIINLRSFGWTLQMQVEPRQLIQAFAVALLAALLAGLYPAWRIGRSQPATALRSE